MNLTVGHAANLQSLRRLNFDGLWHSPHLQWTMNAIHRGDALHHSKVKRLTFFVRKFCFWSYYFNFGAAQAAVGRGRARWVGRVLVAGADFVPGACYVHQWRIPLSSWPSLTLPPPAERSRSRSSSSLSRLSWGSDTYASKEENKQASLPLLSLIAPIGVHRAWKLNGRIGVFFLHHRSLIICNLKFAKLIYSYNTGILVE